MTNNANMLQISNLCEPIKANLHWQPVYRRHFSDRKFTISIRPLSITTDIELIYQWVNEEYAKQFWQMDGRPIQQLKETYHCIQSSDFAQSFVALLNTSPVCQLDIYRTLQDEVSLLYNAQKGDYGVHLLMAPCKKRVPNLSVCVFRTFLEYFFQYPEVERIVGEPDADNLHANNLVRKLGFQFQQQISMSYKTANLYFCTRESFHAAMQLQDQQSNN